MASKKEHLYKEISPGKSILYSWFDAMHTRVDIVMCNQTEADLLRIMDVISNKIAFLEKIGNYFDPESEIYLVNNTAFNNPVKISPELFAIIAQVKEYCKMTLGYFDVSIHSDNYRWGMIHQIILNDNDGTVYFNEKGVKIDLSGFLKGYALDAISLILDEAGVADALINMGNSSVMGKGNHPYGDGWKIGMGKSKNQPEDQTVLLKNQCLTTSGNDHVNRKHIINPYDNTYIEGEKSISIISDNASEGEVLSTALFAAPDTDHEPILRRFKATILS